MTLLELAKQYESDVECRINCVEEERGNLDPIALAPYHQEAVEDCNDQIGHWKITLAQIRTAIKENENSLDTITDNAFDLEDKKNGN